LSRAELENQMTYLSTVPPDQATGTLRDIYQKDLQGDGIANHTLAMSLRPEAIRAWRGLSGAIRGAMDLRRYELATIAAASALRCTY
jgi:alkylhydroperoxidase/carboxymuconolactone decarboxylase family protein YurZ